jgi:hypothetical protein
MTEDFNDFKDRIRSERSIRAQRDAAELQLPGERLRREIREAFAADSRRRSGEERQPAPESGPEPGLRPADDAG